MGNSHSTSIARREDEHSAAVVIESCIDTNRMAGIATNACLKEGEKYAADSLPSDRAWAATVALVPVPFAWGFVYLSIFIVGWVRRGFVTS